MDLLDFGLTPLRDYLPKPVFEAACRRAQRRKFNDGQAIHARGDTNVGLCIVAEGAVRIGRFQHGGSFNLLSIVGPGGHFGDIAMQRTVRTHNAYAVGSTELLVIDAAAIEELMRDEPGFAINLWRCNSARFNAILELYDDARTLGITLRLGKVIYVHAGRGELADGVACVQRDLAEILGVTSVSIGTSLKELESDGLVETGYRCVKVPSKTRLKAWLRKTGAM
ncbi:MAG: Crp/Fnr family transcriptional regulator [Pseudomonadota bacterium]